MQNGVSTSDPDSRITRMKDGTTHLAYKAEHVVDLESEFVLAATVQAGDAADTDTLCDSLLEAQLNLHEAGSEVEIREGVADKGYHAAATIELCHDLNFRQPIYLSRSGTSIWRWTDKPPEYRDAVYANRRRVKGDRGKRLQRLRSERVERSFAHVCETGGARRCWLTGLAKVTKRYLLQAAARNLGLILRKLFGMGTPRGLQSKATLRHLRTLPRFYSPQCGRRSRAPGTLCEVTHTWLSKLSAMRTASRPPRGTADFQQPARPRASARSLHASKTSSHFRYQASAPAGERGSSQCKIARMSLFAASVRITRNFIPSRNQIPCGPPPSPHRPVQSGRLSRRPTHAGSPG